MYIYVYVYVHAYLYICTYVYVCVYIFICTYICIYIYVYIYVCVYLYMYMYVYMCVYVCVCVCRPMYICVNLMVNEYNFHIFYKTFGTCQTTNHICNCFFTNDYVIRCYQTFLIGLSEHLFQQVGWARWLVMWGREKSTKDLVVGFPVVFSVLSLLHVSVQGLSAFSRSFSLSPC